MTIARSLARALCRPVARSVVGGGEGGGAPWAPSQLASALQEFATFAYAGSTIGGLPVLQSSIGTLAQPRGQRCVLFDGVNDIANASPSIAQTNVGTFSCWFKRTASNSGIFCGDGTANNYWLYSDGSRLYSNVAGGLVSVAYVIDSAWHHYCVTRQGTTITFFVDGVQVGTPQTVGAGTFSLTGLGELSFPLGGFVRDARVYSVAKSASEIAAIFNQHLTPTTIDRTGLLAGWWLNEESGTTHYDWSGNGRNLTATNVTQSTYHATDSGVRYNAANELGYTLSGSVVIPRNEAALTQDAAGGALQFAGPIQLPATVEVPCVTGDGTGVYFSLGSNLIQGSSDYSVEWLYYQSSNNTRDRILDYRRPSNLISIGANQNAAYVTESNSVLIESTGAANVSATNVFTVGRWHRMVLTKSGSAISLSITDLVTGSTATLNTTTTANFATDSAMYLAGAFNNNGVPGTQDFSDGRYSDFRITTGGVTRYYPLQDGPGSLNTNRDIHWVASDGTGGVVSNAIVNGTVASIWANRTNVVRDWAIQYGGGIAANGAFIPGRIGSNLDAAGNVKTLAAGEHHNPYSVAVFNPFSAPSLVNIGSTASDKYSPSQMAGVQAESVADTRFASQKRYSAFKDVLTGSDKSNAEAWADA